MVKLMSFVLVVACNEVLGYYHRPSNLYQSTFGSKEQCIINCPKTSQYNPICGSDGVQYYNVGYLACAQQCGVGVTYTDRYPPCEPPKTEPPPEKSEDSNVIYPSVYECIHECPTTSEYNPVCGSDGLQYHNMAQLSCAQFCGVGVVATKSGPCP